jgi:hypothetical protein
MIEDTMSPSDRNRLDTQLEYLRLTYCRGHYQALAAKAAEKQRSHVDYLGQLVEGEAALRESPRNLAAHQKSTLPRAQDARRL